MDRAVSYCPLYVMDRAVLYCPLSWTGLYCIVCHNVMGWAVSYHSLHHHKLGCVLLSVISHGLGNITSAVLCHRQCCVILSVICHGLGCVTLSVTLSWPGLHYTDFCCTVLTVNIKLFSEEVYICSLPRAKLAMTEQRHPFEDTPPGIQ